MSRSAIVVVARFCLISLLIYIVLSLPWLGVRSAYRSMFVSGATTLYHQFGTNGYVLFNAVEGTVEDIEVTMRKVPGTEGGIATIHSGRVGFTTTALTLSLIGATPIAWRRKMWCLLIGIIATQLFVAGRVGLYLGYVYSQEVPFRLFTPGPAMGSILKTAYEFLFNAPGGTVIAAVIIWVMVAVRTPDVNDILGLSDQRLHSATPTK